MTPQKADSPPFVAWVMDFLDQKKAEEIMMFQAPEDSLVTHMIVASGQSARQVSSMAHALYEELKNQGKTPLAMDGLPYADWVIMDMGSIMVHLFRPQVRAYYKLEDLWNKSLAMSQAQGDQ